eukprot:7415845-Alexandrium_andersonii.AAC.1
MPGPGRLPLACLRSNIIVGCPVDFRCGWGLAQPERQKLLGSMAPKVEFYAPRRTAWSQASGRAGPLKRASARALEKPTLERVCKRAGRALRGNRGFILENRRG